MQQPLLLFLGDLGGGEIMLILVVILIFFGAKRIPELARGLGRGLREFKDASQEIRSEIVGAGLPASTLNNTPPRAASYAPAAHSSAAPSPQIPFQSVHTRPPGPNAPA